MEQGGEGGEGENMNEQPQPPPQQPMQNQLRCPRCDSLDTKFCYYNNYSLLQPRHFCKACKRYWTQGGTFRNIPVGGNSCKGKRAKSSSSSSRPQPQPLPQEVVHVQNHPNMTPLIRPVRPSLPMVVHSTSPYYQGGGGYLSSLSTVQSLNPTQPFNQSLNGNVVGSSNLSLPSSFNSASLGSQNHHSSEIQPSQFYHMENRSGIGSIYHAGQGLNASSVTNNSTTLHSDHRASNTSYWSTTRTTSISGNFDQNNIKGDSSSLIPNHWPNHPGCGPTQ